jgi:hypothetical protein
MAAGATAAMGERSPLKEIPKNALECGGWAATQNGDDNSKTLVAKGRFGEGAERYRLLGYDDYPCDAPYDIVPISKLAISQYGDTLAHGSAPAEFSFMFGVVTCFSEEPSTPMTVDAELVAYDALVSQIPHEGRWL